MKVKELMNKMSEFTPIDEIIFSVQGYITDEGKGHAFLGGRSYNFEYDREFWDNRTVTNFSFTQGRGNCVNMWIDCRKKKEV